MKLFLDDIRIPWDCLGYMYKRIGPNNLLYKEEWVIARNYDDFVKIVTENFDNITHISFDHDLADLHYNPETWTQSFEYNEKTGYDCAKWLKENYGDRLPIMFVHSMNPVGTENIINLFK